jgi:hypothetical protein
MKIFYGLSIIQKSLKNIRVCMLQYGKRRFLGYGKTVKEAYEMPRKNPKVEPALAYIPEDEAMIL